MTLPSIRPLLLTLLVATAAAAPAFAADAYQETISAGTALLEKRDLEKALATFQQAAKADPARHEGYFYAAVASYRLGNLSAAEEYAKVALEKASGADKAKVQEMLAVFAQKRDYERLEHEGDEAIGKGLRAKAAELYRKAYLLYPNDGRLGLKAAALFADTLKRPLDALILWQTVIAKADTESVAAARNEISQRQAAIDQIYKKQFALLKGPERKKAAEILAQLVQAFPDRPEVHVELAATHASGKDLAKVVEHLSRASALGADVSTIQYRTEFIYTALDDKMHEFHTFITDAFGPEILETMRSTPPFTHPGTTSQQLANLRKAADAGYSWAYIAIGKAHSDGYGGLAENKAEALKWFQKAAELGDAEGVYMIGSAYRYGHGVKEDYSKAVVYFRQAAALGNPFAMWQLGLHHAKGEGVPKDEAEALKWWREAASSEAAPITLQSLIDHYRQKNNYKEAIAWAQKYAELSGDYWPQFGFYELGQCYRDAPPPLKNLVEARRCFEKSAALGYNSAKEALAKMQ